MPDAQVIDVATKVKEAIAGHTFASVDPQPVTKQVWYFNYEAKDVPDLTVLVAGAAEDWTQLSRVTTLDEVQVRVVVLQHVKKEDFAAVSALVNFVDELKTFLMPPGIFAAGFEPAGNWSWKKTENRPLFDPTELHERSIFKAPITLTYTR